MNLLLVGKGDKLPYILDAAVPPFLIIDDGPIIDQLPRPKDRKYTDLNLSIHHFNPLQKIDYKRARDFVAVLDAVFPEGQNTLTKRGAKFHILKALRGKTTTLDDLITPTKDPHTIDADQQIQTLLLSPVLERVLLDRTNFPLDKTIYARLDRAELGDFDCFVLGNLLISQFRGTVIIPDFGFYGTKNHTQLIRQNRLVAGVRFLDEVPALKNDLLSIDKRIPDHCIYTDAVTLAEHAGLERGLVEFSTFVRESIG